MNKPKTIGLVEVSATLTMIGVSATLAMSGLILPLAVWAQTSGPYVTMPGAQTGGTQSGAITEQTLTVGNTNLFYGLLPVGGESYSPSGKENAYLVESPYVNSNWAMASQRPVAIVPNLEATNEQQGPSFHTPATIEINGGLYCAYVGKTAAVVPATPDFIQFMYSSDGYNWRNVSTYYPPFGATNTSSIVTNDAIPNIGWSTIPYGGTNWLIFEYATNSQLANNQIGRCFALGVTVNSMTNLTFSAPVQINTNLASSANGDCQIISNNSSLYILPLITLVGSSHPWFSTNFFGPYTNLASWTIPGISQDAATMILPLTNNTFWACYPADPAFFMVWSTNYGTNWNSYGNSWLGFNPAFEAGPATGPDFALLPSASMFVLTTPLMNSSATIVQGSDGLFSGTVSAANVSAQTVSAPAVVTDNLICSGTVAGTLHSPVYVRDSLDWGSEVTNSGAYNMVGGEQIIVGPDSAGSTFLGGGYVTDDGQGGYGGAGCSFEFEDGNGAPVNNPLGGNGGFYVNAQTIKFAQAAINSVAGYQANGTAGVTQNLAVQTNSTGPHGITLDFKNGLYVGETPY